MWAPSCPGFHPQQAGQSAVTISSLRVSPVLLSECLCAPVMRMLGSPPPQRQCWRARCSGHEAGPSAVQLVPQKLPVRAQASTSSGQEGLLQTAGPDLSRCYSREIVLVIYKRRHLGCFTRQPGRTDSLPLELTKGTQPPPRSYLRVPSMSPEGHILR